MVGRIGAQSTHDGYAQSGTTAWGRMDWELGSLGVWNSFNYRVKFV